MRPIQLMVRLLTGALLLLVIAITGYLVWYFNRPIPDPIATHPIFEGITYERVVQREPQPLIYHIVTIDLSAPGIGFFVTPPDDIDNFDYAARTTSQFLDEFGVQLAINGDFYDPWRDFGPWDYYPHEGNGVNARGLTISQERIVTEGYAPSTDFGTIYISNNQISFTQPEDKIQQAVSGLLFLKDGENAAVWGDDAYLKQPHPRTVFALDAQERMIIIVVVDGRQPNYSHGATLAELATVIQNRGGYNAINLDGGGSSTLVQMGTDGQSLLLNSPIHTRIPGRERPVANHLGIFANPLP